SPAAPAHAAPEPSSRYRALVARIPGLILIVGTDGTVTWASPSARDLLGREPDSVVGVNALLFCHSDDTGRFTAVLDAATAGEQVQAVDLRFLREDGTAVDLEVHAFD